MRAGSARLVWLHKAKGFGKDPAPSTYGLRTDSGEVV